MDESEGVSWQATGVACVQGRGGSTKAVVEDRARAGDQVGWLLGFKERRRMGRRCVEWLGGQLVIMSNGCFCMQENDELLEFFIDGYNAVYRLALWVQRRLVVASN